jgi:DNA-binding NarL/FixJ family response regulator
VTIRVAIAEDNLLVRQGIVDLLAGESDVEVIAVSGDLPSLERAVEAEDPDVVLTDIRMPPGGTDEGIQFAARLRDTRPRTGVVVLSQHADPAYALALLERGSDRRAYLLKDRVANRAELLAAIRSVAAGGSMIDPKIVEGLVTARARAERSPLNDLTPREREVLGEIAQGKSNAAIGEILGISAHTVDAHLRRIYLKLGVVDRISAALRALGFGLISLEGRSSSVP